MSVQHNKFAIVVSDFNSAITEKLLEGACQELKEQGVKQDHITIIHVPGAVEVPLAAQLLAKKKIYSAIICLSAVIRGETSHYDYVCQQISHGCQQVMLQFDVPVIFGVLTTDNFIQAEERVGGHYGHKGREAAETAIKMVRVVDEIMQTDSCMPRTMSL